MPLIYWCQAHVGAGELGGTTLSGGSLKERVARRKGEGGDEGGKQEQRREARRGSKGEDLLEGRRWRCAS